MQWKIKIMTVGILMFGYILSTKTAEAKNLVYNPNFDTTISYNNEKYSTLGWTFINSKCSEKPNYCENFRDKKFLDDLSIDAYLSELEYYNQMGWNYWNYYVKFGTENKNETIAQGINIPKGANKLRLKFQYKLFNADGLTDDNFDIYIINYKTKEIYFSDQLHFNPSTTDEYGTFLWQQYSYKLNSELEKMKGKYVIVMFIMENSDPSITKVSLDKINLISKK